MKFYKALKCQELEYCKSNESENVVSLKWEKYKETLELIRFIIFFLSLDFILKYF